MGKRREDLLQVIGCVGNKTNLNIVLDTGAAVSLVRKDIVGNAKLRPYNLIIKNVNGGIIPTRGIADIKLRMSEGVFPIRAIVVDKLAWPILLGNDFLRRNQASLDYRSSTIRLGARGKDIVISVRGTRPKECYEKPRDESTDHAAQPMSQGNEDERKKKETGVRKGRFGCFGDDFMEGTFPSSTKGKVTMAEDKRIPPRSSKECELNGSALQEADVHFVPAEGITKRGIGVGIPRVRNGKTIATLTNHRNHPQAVFENTTVGRIEGSGMVVKSREWEPCENKHDPVDYSESKTVGINDELSPIEREQIEALIKEFTDVFAWSPKEIGRTALVEHAIPVEEGCIPIHQAPYRVSHKEKALIRSQVNEMLELGVIRPSTSPWSSPVVMVKKKDGNWRFCVDYRKLNAVTCKDVYPLPVIEDLLSYLGKAKYFASLDLFSGYWQIPVKEIDKSKTAFVTAEGHFEFNVLSFGLCSAPATFQYLADTLFAELKWKKVLVYLDDIIVFAENYSEFLENLKEVLLKLREAGLTLKPSKCHFAMSSLKLLGYAVGRDGIRPDKSKVQAVSDFRTPRSVKDVQSFIGLCNYYRKFIKDFSMIARPLHDLTKKGRKFEWSEREEGAFRLLKDLLISAPVLAHYDPSLPIELRVDASGYGLGAILLQERDNVKHPIAYASRSLTKAETNYSTTEKECLAAVWALNYFRAYVWGHKVFIVSDHHALCWLKTIKEPAGRLARWSLKLQDCDYEVRHKSGKAHADADCLSRNPVLTPTEDDEEQSNEIPLFSLTNEEISDVQRRDPALRDLIEGLEDPSKIKEGLERRINNFKIIEGILMKKNAGARGNPYLMVIPEEMKKEILYSNHDDPLSGHMGFARTYDKVNLRYYWQGMKADVQRYVRSCPDCQVRKGPNQRPGGFLQAIRPGRPFEKIGVDLLGPFRRSRRGKTMIIVATDYSTRWVETKALANGTAEQVARFLLEQVVCRHGSPKTILSDQGKAFQSKVLNSLLKSMGIERSFSTAYHPQTNGLTERFNKTLAEMLSAYTGDEQKDWDEFLPQVTFAYNTTKQATTAETPYYLVHGREAVMPQEAAIIPDEGDQWVRMARERLDAARKEASRRIERRQVEEAKRYDSHRRDVHFEEGDTIRLYTPTRKVGRSEKLIPQYHGPYKIVKQVGPVNYEIQKKRGKREIVHVSRISPYYERK